MTETANRPEGEVRLVAMDYAEAVEKGISENRWRHGITEKEIEVLREAAESYELGEWSEGLAQKLRVEGEPCCMTETANRSEGEPPLNETTAPTYSEDGMGRRTENPVTPSDSASEDRYLEAMTTDTVQQLKAELSDAREALERALSEHGTYNDLIERVQAVADALSTPQRKGE